MHTPCPSIPPHYRHTQYPGCVEWYKHSRASECMVPCTVHLRSRIALIDRLAAVPCQAAAAAWHHDILARSQRSSHYDGSSARFPRRAAPCCLVLLFLVFRRVGRTAPAVQYHLEKGKTRQECDASRPVLETLALGIGRLAPRSPVFSFPAVTQRVRALSNRC